MEKQIRALLRWWRTAGLILVAVLLTGLAAPFTQAAQEANVLRIGYLGMTGSPTANGAQLAIDQINSAGGVSAPDGVTYRLELLTLDADPTVDTMRDAIGKLVAQDVNVLLGPDTNAQITPDTIQALVAAGRPILTPATGDALTDMDASNLIFRIRAPERVLSNAIATYLTSDLGLVSVVAVQTEVEFTEALMEFEDALTRNGVQLADKIQLPGGDALVGETQRLLSLSPQAIVMWGAYQDAVTLLGILRDNNWPGLFVYRRADGAAQADVLPPRLADGVLGMTTWSYGDPLQASGIFLRDYIVAFGEVPDALSAAAYDAMWFLRFAVAAQGATPASIQAGLIGGSPRTLVQGVFHPVDYGNGDLVRIGVVYKLGTYGGPSVVARFDDTTRLQLEQAGITPTATPAPVVETPVPQETPLPTATLQGTWIEVKANALNVRNGPGFEYDKIGQVKAGEQYRVLGAIADYSWLAIDFQGGVGWVKTEFTTVLGDLGAVSVIQAPPTPTPAAPPTATLPSQADLVIDSVVLNPPQPIPNQPFTATITVRNAGGAAAGRFAVAATWEPGSVYTATFIDGLAAGQSAQAFLTPTVSGSGIFQVAVIVDLNNDVPEFNESNNTYNITYRVDYPLFANQGGVQVNVSQQLDLFPSSTNPDLQWDGYTLAMLNGAEIGQLAGVTYENVTYDMLNPAVVSYNGTGYGPDKVQTGAVFAFITAESYRAAMRVDNLQSGGPIWLSYRVYNGTP
jgi:branched-chain amino acid transport system substrate-binding protein